jgi:DNA-binding beta-propeller fold protein YncE
MNMRRRSFLASALVVPGILRGYKPQIGNLTADGAVNNPYGLRIGPDGSLYVCEIGNHRVSRIDVTSGAVQPLVADQKEPYEVQFASDGSLLFVDMPAHSVRRWDKSSDKVITIAGTGNPGFSGDGGPAAQAQLRNPHSIAVDREGQLLICDIGNHRIRRVDLKTGVIGTFAGTGEPKPTPDGSPREGTPLNGPRAIDFNANGQLFVVLREGNAVYRLENERWRHFAGTGEKGYSGDGSDARRAKLSGPKAICCARDAVYIADTESHTIRRIARDGIITTIAGTGERGDGPVGDPLQCKLSRPHGVYVDSSGRVYIGDSECHRVRVIG